MKKVFSVAVLIVFVMNLYAQKQTFDMVNYEMPKGWDKIVTENGVQLSTKDDGKGNYAAVVIVRSAVSTASANENFNNSWNNLVKGTVKVSEAPTMSDMDIEEGWTCITGQANYTDGGRKGLVTLITATGEDKMVNVVIMTNTQNYQEDILAFVNSLELAKIKQQEEVNTGQLHKSSVVGLWTNYILETTGYNVGGMPQYTAGYLRKEYNFNANGTYTFRNKQWLTNAPDITYLYETGTYSIKGNQLTLTPVSGKAGFWAKTNSTKEWGRLKKYTDYKLEKTTYTFEMINDPTYGNSIVMKPSKPTQRDGGQFNAPNDPLEFRYSFRDIESLIDNPPGFKLSEVASAAGKKNLSNSANSVLAGKIFESTSPEKSGSGNMQFKTGGYWTWQYHFYNDGTYRFVFVAASHFNETKLLQYETGTYTVQENQVTISPSKGANEEWSKIGKTSNGNSDVSNRAVNDTWNKKLKTSNRKLEKITYPFSIEYWEGNKANVLALQHANVTERDGSPGNNNNSYYFEITSGKSDLSLPKGF